MNYVTNFNSTGYTGEYSISYSGHDFVGTISCDADKNLKSFAGDVTTGSGDNKKKVGSFSIFFNEADTNVQDAFIAAIKSVRGSVRSDLNS